jgi:hypothetical protein
MPSIVPSALEGLAERIRKGEVVFFVGAGFSIDSEGLSAWEIVWRLRIRLEALCGAVKQEIGNGTWDQFCRTFGGQGVSGAKLAEVLTPPGRSVAETTRAVWHLGTHVAAVSNRYYEFNDWLCDAFGELMLEVARMDSGSEAVLRDLSAKEAHWVEAARDANDQSAPKAAPSVIPDCVLAAARTWGDPSGKGQPVFTRTMRALGKLVLMATFGLFDPRVLAGCCHGLDAAGADRTVQEDPRVVAQLYGERLKLRHHVLARFAREGFCPTLITTNFDLLIEGALRLSGLEEAASESGDRQIPAAALGEALALLIPRYDVISDPQGFYRRGKAYRTATLVKIHGCAGRVRGMESLIASSDSGDQARVHAYLRQVVYTYREIQNWRADHWTADLLRTLLRTRTLVFGGYSTADPVIHDTFRSVYEEMERHQGASIEVGNQGGSAPAYFLGFSKGERASEFHAEQVLRSASRAVGHSLGGSGHAEHPHYLRFGPGSPEQPQLALDELMGLLSHQVFRRQQRDALRTEGAALVARLTGRRWPRSEVEAVIEGFGTLADAEWDGLYSEEISAEAVGRAIRQALGWSGGFHVSLRREWALALALGQRQGAGLLSSANLVRRMRHPLWYFPASERPGWTAWSAVVELALRNLAVHLAPPNGEPPSAVEATHNILPTVILPYRASPHGAGVVSRIALTIQVGGLDRMDKPPVGVGFPARRVVWSFAEDALPWTVGTVPEAKEPSSRPGVSQVTWMASPPASCLWDWARNVFEEGAVKWVGLPDGRPAAKVRSIS